VLVLMMEEGSVYVCGNVTWETSLIKNKRGKAETVLWTPHRLEGAPKGWKVVTGSSSFHCFVLTTNGEAYGFGRNGAGQIGVGKYNAAVHVPQKAKVGSADDPVIDAACGKAHSLFLLKSGAVFGCGVNGYGQLGTGSTSERCHTPVKCKIPGDKKCRAVAAGLDFSLVLTEDGEVYSFGCGEYGKLGIGTDGAHNTSGSSIKMGFHPFPTPRKILGLEDVRLIAAGNHHGLAATRTRVFAWGYGAYGRLGLGSTKNKDVFRPEMCECSGWVAMGKRLTEDKCLFKKLAAGKESSLAVLSERMTTYAWGKVKAAQPEADMYPKILQDLQGWDIRSISLGAGFIMVAADTSVIAWGAGTEGSLGFGDPPKFPKSSAQARKVEPLEGLTALSISAGANHTVMVLKETEDSKSILDALNTHTPVNISDADVGNDEDDFFETDGRKRKGPGRGRGRGRGRGVSKRGR